MVYTILMILLSSGADQVIGKRSDSIRHAHRKDRLHQSLLCCPWFGENLLIFSSQYSQSTCPSGARLSSSRICRHCGMYLSIRLMNVALWDGSNRWTNSWTTT